MFSPKCVHSFSVWRLQVLLIRAVRAKQQSGRAFVCLRYEGWMRSQHRKYTNAPSVPLCVLEDLLLQRHRQTKARDEKGCDLSGCCVFCCVSASPLHWNAPGLFVFFLVLCKPSGSFFTHFKWTSHGIRASLNGIWWIWTKIFNAALLFCTTSANPSNSEPVLYEAAGRLRCFSCLS